MSEKKRVDCPLPDYKQEQEQIGQKKILVDTNQCKSKILAGMDGHNWKQKGPYLVCTSCKLKHAIYIGLTKRITQLKKSGEIVLENVA